MLRVRVYLFNTYIYSMTSSVYTCHTFLLLAHVHSYSPVLEVLIDRCRSLHGWSQLNTAISRTDVGLCAELKLQGWQSNAYRSRVSWIADSIRSILTIESFFLLPRIFLPSRTFNISRHPRSVVYVRNNCRVAIEFRALTLVVNHYRPLSRREVASLSPSPRPSIPWFSAIQQRSRSRYHR